MNCALLAANGFVALAHSYNRGERHVMRSQVGMNQGMVGRMASDARRRTASASCMAPCGQGVRCTMRNPPLGRRADNPARRGSARHDVLNLTDWSALDPMLPLE